MFENRAEIVGWVFAVLLVAGMGFLALHGSFNQISHAGAAAGGTVTVKIVTDPKTIGRYDPATIHLRTGQAVAFINDSNADHTVTAHDGKSFDSKNIGKGAQWVYTAAQAGTFPYICLYHPFMKGTIVVSG